MVGQTAMAGVETMKGLRGRALLIAEFERSLLRGRRGAAVGALLKTIHDCARGLRWSLLSEPAARSPASLLSTR